MKSSLVIAVLLFCFCEPIITIQITIEQGTLEGVVSKSRNGTEYFSFYGIPYAKPPVGQLRFEPPQEADSWKGVRNAKTQPPACPQSALLNFVPANDFFGQEDCLYLNVFSPNVTSSTLSLPVMVYIHGGAFFSGSSTYGPVYFMDHPIVVVTIQYRLGVLGFLSAADEILPGNYGMKDQSAALRWVRKNIRAFGGDPERVTIFGQSAGAASVHFHVHSPLSKGLFHQAISNSGTSLAMFAVTTPETAKKRAHAFGVVTGCIELKNTSALVECLRKVPVMQLIQAFHKFFVYDFTPPVPFGVVVESKNVPNAFLVQNPWKQNPVSAVPWMVGINTDDGAVFSARIRSMPQVMDEWIRDFNRLLPLALHYLDKTTSKNASDITEAIKKQYFGNDTISPKTGKKLEQMFTDGFFLDSLEAARRHNNKVFYYFYEHRNNHTFNEFYGNLTEVSGPCHSDELIGLFDLEVFPLVTEGPDYKVSQRMVNYYINFIQKGEPNGKEKIWQPFGSENFDYLHITSDADVMKQKLLYDKYVFWKNVVYLPINHV